MPLLSQHSSNEYTKLLCIGNPGSGKSGGMCSLVAADYRLRILDMDNGLEVLKNYVLKECPEKIGNVEYRTLRDKRKASPDGPVVDGPARAFINALKMLDSWKYDDIDLGPPAEWGPECILAVDTLTFLSHAAFDFREPLTPRGRDGKYDKRAIYRDAQDDISKFLGYLNSEWFETNVIVNTHIQYQEREDGTVKGFPTSVGSALGPKIGMYFNTIALFETDSKGNHVIRMAPTAMIDLKNPKPFEMAKTYPLETGLADIFEVLRTKPEPKVTKLMRRI